MAHFPLMNARVYLSEFDVSGDLNNIQIARTQADLDDTTFVNSGFRERITGLSDGVFSFAGLSELTDQGQDEIFHTRFALVDCPVLVTLRGATDGDRCKFATIMQGSYSPGGTVGGRAEFSAEGKLSNHVMTDGFVMAVGAKTGTFNGTWRELGAVTSSQKVYASIHAYAKSSFTSAVFKVQSADDGIGTNATTRITFTTITDLTSQFSSLSGAITQTFWRVICDSFTGTSLTIVSAVGIQ